MTEDGLAAASERAPKSAPLAWRDVSDPVERESARMDSFRHALDAVKSEVDAQLGEDDVRYIRRVNRLSRGLEVFGRVVLHFSLGPISFLTGVLCLTVHKCLETMELGHSALHGAFDRFEELPELHSERYYWEAPIDEEAWKYGHNVRHHMHTNIAGKDGDIHFGQIRLTEHTPHSLVHRIQQAYAIGFLLPMFTDAMNCHFAGVVDYWRGNGRAEQFDFIKDRSWGSFKESHAKAFRKYGTYYAKNYLLFPLLAGAMWWKVLCGNLLANLLRNIYTGLTIFCGHVGEDVADFPEGTKARGRGRWYAMQVEASQNYRVPWALSVLSGALDLQIEHHLFPKLPPNRLRQIQPQVEAICAEHDVAYRMESWATTLRTVFSELHRLSRPVELAS